MNAKDIVIGGKYKLIRHERGEATVYGQLHKYIGGTVTVISAGLGFTHDKKHFRVRFSDGNEDWRVWDFELAPVDGKSGFAKWVEEHGL